MMYNSVRKCKYFGMTCYEKPKSQIKVKISTFYKIGVSYDITSNYQSFHLT
jgi:hypothetical protein